MKLTLKILVIGISLTMFNACNKDEETTPKLKSTSINKTLPLGASRVEGFRPNFESYRYELWKDLKENNWAFDFVGTRYDGASYPTFNNENFDVDREGRGGFASGEILQGLNGWLSQTGVPDIVLFSSTGDNDILNGQDYDQTVSNVNAIIDALQVNNPDVTIIIEQPAQGRRSDFIPTEYTNAFNQMRQDVLTIATDKTTITSKVIAVDMFTGFNESHLADEVHYNEAGAEFIATRYCTALINLFQQ